MRYAKGTQSLADYLWGRKLRLRVCARASESPHQQIANLGLDYNAIRWRQWMERRNRSPTTRANSFHKQTDQWGPFVCTNHQFSGWVLISITAQRAKFAVANENRYHSVKSNSLLKIKLCRNTGTLLCNWLIVMGSSCSENSFSPERYRLPINGWTRKCKFGTGCPRVHRWCVTTNSTVVHQCWRQQQQQQNRKWLVQMGTMRQGQWAR